MSLLSVEKLNTHFITRNIDNQIRVAKALNDVTFSLEQGEVLGLVGETGAGKSLTAQSICGLLNPPARIVSGRVTFNGSDLTAMDPDELNRLRGADIAMVVQNPRTSLDPLSRIGDQLVRIHQSHSKGPIEASRARALEMMEAVGLPDPKSRVSAWPHELSGGMAQRVLIAMALMNDPKLLIADEPTTGLDVTVQAQILDLLRNLVERFQMAALVITHDLGIVAHYCDRMAVMFAGGIVESGAVEDVFDAPAHPYTQNLIASTPERLHIGGSGPSPDAQPPDLFNLPTGCHLRYRCVKATDLCTKPPPLREIGSLHVARCHFAGDSRETAADPAPTQGVV